MKKIIFTVVFCILFLSGCQKDSIAPFVSLKYKRIQVPISSKIDYMSYIKEATDNKDGNIKEKVQYNTIDTSKIGKYNIDYILTDQAGNTTKKTLIIDVVTYINEELYNPEDIDADIVKNPEDITVLVNKVNALPSDWKPSDLEKTIDSGHMLRKEANEAYTNFYKAAKKQGISIYTISAYREHEKQEFYWNNQVKISGLKHAIMYSAYPGRSEHETGLAIDVSYAPSSETLDISVKNSDLGKFIESDAYKYGFILRYPEDKVKITNYSYEPWHMRYVGVELATKLHEENLTLDEYYNRG